MMRRTLPLVALAAVMGLSAVKGAEGEMKYPPTRRVDQVDEFHGTKVPDPFRWLEDDVRKSKEVAGWVAAQNKVTFGFLEQIPARGAIKERLTKLWPCSSLPS